MQEHRKEREIAPQHDDLQSEKKSFGEIRTRSEEAMLASKHFQSQTSDVDLLPERGCYVEDLFGIEDTQAEIIETVNASQSQAQDTMSPADIQFQGQE